MVGLLSENFIVASKINFIILAILTLAMEIKITDSYNLYFYDKYVIAEAHENAVVDSRLTQKITQQLLDYYDRKPFTLISHRKNNYSISRDAYNPKNFRKIKNMAVVSTDPAVKERAILEQLQFANSFAFFEKLEDAISWAQSHYYTTEL